MPLHLNSFIKESENRAVLAWILQDGINECDSFFASPDGVFLHLRRNLTDIRSRQVIGWLVFTLRRNEERKTLEILDVDIVLENHNPSGIRFLELRDGSSDANEYYDAEIVDTGQRLIVETVNRHTEPKDILGTERDVFVSAFPFELNVYKDTDAFNRLMGFSEPVQVGDTDYMAAGFSDNFSMPGGLFSGKDQKENNYSFLVGRVVSFQDAELEFGDIHVPFVLAQVDTAPGTIPVAMSREVFNLDGLKEGCMIAMNADVKADLGKPKDFRQAGE